jgi:pyruvate kinase
MERAPHRYTERPLVKTKIIATVGPACESVDRLRALVVAGVDLFRLNFAHGSHAWLEGIVRSIRTVAAELQRPIGILGDLAGPKIRLGQLPDDGVCCVPGGTFRFVREATGEPTDFTATYPALIDDLFPGDRVLLADGTVSLRVVEKAADGSSVSCRVEHGGCVRSRQGINLPGAKLSTPALTEKDRVDLRWAVAAGLDFIGLSFVREAADIIGLRKAIEDLKPEFPPHIVAKIEKPEAIDNLESILEVTDGVMVARGDLGVEVDIERVPPLQKRIIRLCNRRRLPVITATQMLDSMQTNERPTRAEASDVANAVLDGSDAVMLSGETAIGDYPVKAVTMMSRIAAEAERLVKARDLRVDDFDGNPDSRATVVTEAVTMGASLAAEQLHADLMAVATKSGKTAMAVSKQRSPVPVLALTDRPETARRICLYWGVMPLVTDIVRQSPQDLIEFVTDWGRRESVFASGSRFVVVANSDWTQEGHDLMLVHVVP